VIKTDVRYIKENVSELGKAFRAEMQAFRAEMNEFRTRHERDFRILFAALISVALGLSAVMAKGFGWIH